MVTPLLLGHAVLATVTRVVAWLPAVETGVTPIQMLQWPFPACHGVGLCFAADVVSTRKAMSNWVTPVGLLLGLAR